MYVSGMIDIKSLFEHWALLSYLVDLILACPEGMLDSFFVFFFDWFQQHKLVFFISYSSNMKLALIWHLAKNNVFYTVSTRCTTIAVAAPPPLQIAATPYSPGLS